MVRYQTTTIPFVFVMVEQLSGHQIWEITVFCVGCLIYDLHDDMKDKRYVIMVEI